MQLVVYGCLNWSWVSFATQLNWFSPHAAHWHILNQCRAIENGAFVISPCAIGDIEGGGGSYGHSLIIDPWGQVIADGGDKRGVVIADINIELVNKVRDQLPSLAHDRNFEVLKCE